MRKILFALFGVFLSVCANGAQIANVEYVHLMIKQYTGVDVPYNSELKDVHAAANMKYLLTAVDIANQMLNGQKITDYGNSEYATTRAADTVAVDTMVRDYVRDYKFFATTTPDTESFEFSISASGVFHIDWGDGKREGVRKSDTSVMQLNHVYDMPGEYVIKIAGYSTGYAHPAHGSAISFAGNTNLAKIDGNLGHIFKTVAPKVYFQPSFANLFSGCVNLSGQIPSGLFGGIYGQPILMMFESLFNGCSNLTGEIPGDLFAGIDGVLVASLFNSTFKGCSGLMAGIPAGLFAGVHGAPGQSTFANTFSGCSGLTGSIPAGLFAGLDGAPAVYMFMGTFSGCSGLTGEIPAGLFAGLDGAPVVRMFEGTFSGCRGLTGIGAGVFGNLYGAPAAFMFRDTFLGCSGLTGNIPSGLFGNLYGATAQYMFSQTFSGCSGLIGDIPDGLFGNISGVATPRMFYATFSGCSGLTGESAKINGKYLYEIWPDETAVLMYRGCKNLTDYADIPATWK